MKQDATFIAGLDAANKIAEHEAKLEELREIRDQAIIELRGDGMPASQISQHFGVTRQWITKLYNNAGRPQS